MKNLIYVIGPFRANTGWEIENNVRNAETVALDLWKAGFAVICPHTNTRFFHGMCEDDTFLDGDLEILSRCDGALCINGWKDSIGSIIEINFCKSKQIPVFDYIGKLQSYFSKPKDQRTAEYFVYN